jgi:hypothetical protein
MICSLSFVSCLSNEFVGLTCLAAYAFQLLNITNRYVTLPMYSSIFPLHIRYSIRGLSGLFKREYLFGCSFKYLPSVAVLQSSFAHFLNYRIPD